MENGKESAQKSQPQKSPLSIRPTDRRLIRGYGPGLMLIVAFLVMVLLVPTIAPEQTVASNAAGAGQTQGIGAPSGLPASGVGGGVSGAGSTGGAGGSVGSGTSGGAAGSAGAGTTIGTSAGSAASSGTTGRSGGGGAGASSSQSKQPAKVAACSGSQVRGDPYSPPCISFSGNNGGATSKGVTGSTINVTWRLPADGISSINAAIQQLSGKYNTAAFNDSNADIERTLQDLATYFNDHFQLYGRKINLKIYKGQGTLTSEFTGGGQAQANADALTSAGLGAFADVSALSQPYSQALSSQHIVNVGAPYMSEQFFQQNAPYAWSYQPDCSDLANESAPVVIKQVADAKVSWGGPGVSNGQPRKYAVLAPNNPVYQQCVGQFTAALKKAGVTISDNISYSFDLSQLSQEASSIQQQIVNNKITTVLTACDPILLIFLTGDLDHANYEPEEFNIGAGFTDEDLVAQLFDQSAWAHAAGVTNNANVPPYGSSLGYFAAKSVDPNNPPAHQVDTLYEEMYILALGIEMAGPNLTPATFQQGLFSYRGGDGEYGPWSFNLNGSGQWTTQHEFRYEWWDPKALSSFDQEDGTWVTGKTVYPIGMVPAGPAPVFPNGTQ